MAESYVEDFIHFKSDPQTRAEYINTYGNIRLGKVLENLDALAGSIAYLHCDDGRSDTPPLTIVTASVDRIDMLQPIPPDQDIKLNGFVTCVGKSSMEISLTVETIPEGPHQHQNVPSFPGSKHNADVILSAKFTMVARDPETHKAAPVNQLLVETEEERKLNKLSIAHKQRKQAARRTDLSKQPPSVEEMYLIHDLYLEYVKYLHPETSGIQKPDDVMWMKDTIQQTLVMCMPQDRNIHNNIFGGYLMRLAYELAYSTTLIFTKSRILFLALDDIMFQRPVPIGSLLSLTSQVVYSSPDDNTCQIKVRADVVDPLSGARETTNTFSFTFGVPGGGG